MRKRRPQARLLVVATVLAAACGPRVLTPSLHQVSAALDVGGKSVQVKAHMRSGELYVLDSWRLAEDGRVLEGTGTRYTVLREPRGTGQQALPVEEIALLETNNSEMVSSLGVFGLSTLTTVWGALSVACVADPKSCFGSCPTFYLEDDADRPRAEGFSASIARALEARDVDALPDARPRAGRLAIRMRNEALETHAVRRLRLLAAPRPAGGQVFATEDGRFFPARRVAPPSRCRGPEGDCLAPIARADGQDRLSEADAADLATREELELLFPDPPEKAGIVIGARQSLMTTFLFYQSLAYMGPRAGEYLAALERGGPERALKMMGMARVLGGIDVEVAGADHAWRSVGRFDEAGPIAGDVQVIPLQAPLGPLRVRLRMAKGHWRLDWVALAELGAPVPVRPIEAESVERAGRPDPAALATLRSGLRHLVTLPGDEYRVAFRVGDTDASELFLESEGYYYEWLRAEWWREEDPAMAALIVGRPEEALRRMAGSFKAHEAAAEQAFWNSRFRR